MNSMTLTFQEALDKSSKCKGNRHLILGNGFSIDLFPQIFSYATLREGAIKAGLKDLFDKFETNDFEYVMRKILDAKQVLEALYPNDNTKLKEELNTISRKAKLEAAA